METSRTKSHYAGEAITEKAKVNEDAHLGDDSPKMNPEG